MAIIRITSTESVMISTPDDHEPMADISIVYSLIAGRYETSCDVSHRVGATPGEALHALAARLDALATAARLKAREYAAPAAPQAPSSIELTESLVAYLAENGVEISMASTGAIRLPNGEIAHVRERRTGKGALQIVITHQPRGGRAQAYDQRFSTRARALKAIREATR